jgi:hypothetical protein
MINIQRLNILNQMSKQKHSNAQGREFTTQEKIDQGAWHL